MLCLFTIDGTSLKLVEEGENFCMLRKFLNSLNTANCMYQFVVSGRDSSVGRAADCHATGPGFNTHSKPGCGLTQPSIPLWVGKMSTSKNIG